MSVLITPGQNLSKNKMTNESFLMSGMCCLYLYNYKTYLISGEFYLIYIILLNIFRCVEVLLRETVWLLGTKSARNVQGNDTQLMCVELKNKCIRTHDKEVV